MNVSGTVLFVDDERNVLNALQRLFVEDETIRVVVADGGDAALEVLATEPVDVIVSDHLMPGMNGVELFERTRELYPDIPRIMLTGCERDRQQEILAALGEELTILTKPWESERLRGAVVSVLAAKSLDPEAADLIRLGGLTLDTIERARRIQSRMRKQLPLGEILVQSGALSAEAHARIQQARRAQMTIAELLVESGALSGEGLRMYEETRAAAPNLGDRELLCEARLVTEEQYLRAYCGKYGVPYVEPDVGEIDTALLATASTRYLLRHRVLPVRIEDDAIVAIMAEPHDRQLLAELARMFERPIVAWCCVPDKICEALRTLERIRAGKGGEGGTTLQYRVIEEPEAEDGGEEAVQIVDYLVLRAIQLGASDLHIEPMQNKIRVRVRVDGVLQPLTDLPSLLAPRIASRIKILASADIAEKRQHQDGKIFVKVEGSEVDIRVSSYVSIYGETLVLRLLDRNRNLMSLEKIGFQPNVASTINDVVLRSSSGLVLVTGPTGSGKTTTLYSFVEKELDPTEKVITCEDPVEYVLEGVVQCSVNQKTGPTFSDSLRAMLRQDPDTIIVGEVRDQITAGLAFECALTGHKVYSTFHTEDAVSVIVRLLDMGVEPFLVSSSLSAILAQRLMRRLCDRCAVVATPSRADLRFLGIDRAWFNGLQLKTAVGCGHCKGGGYVGRLGMHELLIPGDDFRDAILRRAPAKELRQLARELPEFLTLQEDALLKCVAGVSSIDEVVANAPRDLECRPLAELQAIAAGGMNR